MTFWSNLRGNCRECLSTPLTRSKMMVFGGITLFIIIFIIILACTIPTGSGSKGGGTPAGHTVLQDVPLTSGRDNLAYDLKLKSMNQINQKETATYLTDYFGDLTKGMVGAQIWSVGVNCGSQYNDSTSQITEQIDVITRISEQYSDKIIMVLGSDDILKAKQNKKVGGLMALDGGYAIDSRMAVLRSYYRLGVRVMALGGDCDTPWSLCSNTKQKNDFGLNEFGKSVVKEMNRIGMVIDLTGSSTLAQSIAIDTSAAPVIFSSSNAASIQKHNYNVDNDTLTKLKAKDGLVMISFLNEQLCAKNCSLDNVVAHLTLLRNMLGVDKIGIGGNFGQDKKEYPDDFKNATFYPELFDRLANPKKGEIQWTEGELKKLAYSNFERIFKAVEKTKNDKLKEKPNEDILPADNLDKTNEACYTDLSIRYPKKSDTKQDEKNTSDSTKNKTDEGNKKAPSDEKKKDDDTKKNDTTKKAEPSSDGKEGKTGEEAQKKPSS